MTIPRNLSFLAQGASSTGVLSVPYGGTGLTTLTANYIPYGNGTSALNNSSNLQFNGTNLSVGGATKAWSGVFSAIDIYGIASALTAQSTSLNLGSNYYNNGSNYIYSNSGYAQLLQLNDLGEYRFNTAPSGTAGNSFTFTERMRIFASGGVSIGNTTDPGAGNLSVNGGGISIPSNLNVTTNGYTVLYADSSQILYTGGLTSAVISGAGLNVYGPSSSGGVGPIAMVNGFATTKKWTMGPNSGGTFLVYNDAGVGTYLTYGGTTWTPNVSDSRLKNKVSDIYNALDAINLLNPLTFYYKNESQDGTPRYGHFAQDVGNAIPDAKIISPQKDDILGDIYTYDPNIINVYLVKALQELSAKFDAYVASHP